MPNPGKNLLFLQAQVYVNQLGTHVETGLRTIIWYQNKYELLAPHIVVLELSEFEVKKLMLKL